MAQISKILKDIGTFGRLYRERQFAPLGITSRQALYLREIGAVPGISQEQLTAPLGINKSNVARAVAALEEEGYIARRVCGMDKRVLRLYPTEKTLALLPKIEEVMATWETLLVAGLTEVEQQGLQTMLMRVRDSALSAGKGEDA